MSPFMSIVAIYCKGTFNTWPKIKTFAASFRFATCTKHVYEKKITAVMAPLVLDLRFKPLTDSIRYVDNTYVIDTIQDFLCKLGMKPRMQL